MLESTLLEAASQLREGEAGAVFREYIRLAVISSFSDVMMREVEMLCGLIYTRSGNEAACRAGSAPGVCVLGGRVLGGRTARVELSLVRRRTSVGSEEFHLESYKAEGCRSRPRSHTEGSDSQRERA